MERGRGGGLSRWMEDDWCIRWGTSDSGTLLCRRELYICKPIPQRKKGGASEIVTIGVINGYVIRFFFFLIRERFFVVVALVCFLLELVRRKWWILIFLCVLLNTTDLFIFFGFSLLMLWLFLFRWIKERNVN
jgi:hypothetical protein